MRYLRGILAACMLMSTAHAANFPALTGRVVDGAHLLSGPAQQSLESELANFETRTRSQLVVVTVPSLEGQAIEEYGYQLGRHWGIGQKGTNNGVLLIVAPKERSVRIEVGYGLEGTLTDAATSNIIQTIILPAFKRGNMQDGIVQGTRAIVTVAGGGQPPLTQPAASMAPGEDGNGFLVLAVIVLFMFSQLALFILYVVGRIIAFVFSLLGFNALRRFLDRMKAKIMPADRALLAWLLMPSGRITGSGGGSFRSGGGFSGGGGSFGGGGSSGRW